MSLFKGRCQAGGRPGGAPRDWPGRLPVETRRLFVTVTGRTEATLHPQGERGGEGRGGFGTRQSSYDFGGQAPSHPKGCPDSFEIDAALDLKSTK